MTMLESDWLRGAIRCEALGYEAYLLGRSDAVWFSELTHLMHASVEPHE
jgi:hypothetical protein